MGSNNKPALRRAADGGGGAGADLGRQSLLSPPV